jgi:hypothetical protein
LYDYFVIEAPVNEPETPPARDGQSPGAGSGVAAKTIWQRAVQWIPPKARLAVLTGSLVLAGFGIYSALSSGTSTLQIVCRHNFRAADVSVRVDGALAFSEHLSGAARKRLGVFEQVEGNYSKSLSLSSGEHLVEVRLKSADDGFDQAKSSRVNLPRGEAATLQVSTSRSAMSLAYQGPEVSSAGWSSISGNAISLLVTLIGSAVSAGIGFFVQEFLKSKKPA